MFRVAAQCGLKPDELLDMSLDTFNAVREGYADRLFDLQLLSIQSGFWSGYYGNSKHPKPLNNIMNTMIRNKVNKKSSHVEDIDVESFLEKERRRKEFLDGNKD